MRKYLIFIFLITILSCKQRTEAQLIKYCDGTYMLIDGEYYRICNRDDFTSISSGTYLNIKYKIVEGENCDANLCFTIQCILPFTYSGKIIEVKILD